MKIDADTINVLKSFSKINPSIVFSEGNIIKSTSPKKSVKAIARVKTNFPKRFAIYNLDRFIGILSTFNDPDMEFTDTSVIISDNNKKINYVYADESTLKIFDKEIPFPSPYITCTLTNENLKDVEKAAGILAFPEIVISGDGSNLYIQAMNSANPSADVYSINIGYTDKVFRAVFNCENIKFLPRNYEVNIASSGIAHFVSEDVEYYIVIEAKPSMF